MANGRQTETVTCTIDGHEVTVPKGSRIIEAAEQIGIGIVHYCYHPALSAPAMCRMCLVEVEGAPKLQPACVTPVSDGAVIRTDAEKAAEARTGVLEFYLINHPLDCPVCDASGECKLQDYVFQEGRKRGRFVEPKRVLGEDDFGGDVIYDGDRCIMCTRCTRYMKEVAGDERLCVVQRGNRSVIDTFFDEGLDGSPFASNIIDICPVGALLSKDFLHKARAWDLDRTPSICPSCSQGCNITLDVRDNLVQRLKPRHNPDVNSYWMCDYGRYTYEWMNRGAAEASYPVARGGAAADGDRGAGTLGWRASGSRIEEPRMKGPRGLEPVSWQDAIRALVDRLRAAGGATVVGSPYHGNEDNGLLRRLQEVVGGGEAVYRSPRAPDEVALPGFPKLTRRRDLSANARGLEEFGFHRVGDDRGAGGVDVKGGAVVVLGDPLADLPEGALSGASLVVYLGAVDAPAVRDADFVLPVTSFAEQEGTFTNVEGRVQRFWPGLNPPPQARPAWQVLGVLLAGLEDGQAPASAGAAFVRIAELYDAFGGLSYAQLGTRGALLNEPVRIGAGPGVGG
ncbi:MAG TPA: 2Fe-2S iron-sulfur cluster-binding protein [Longimicrobiales bacterium]|nr:2Fe-2S iron-sulfur cluster-binding protein [Longimicrobiales bacterium]